MSRLRFLGVKIKKKQCIRAEFISFCHLASVHYLLAVNSLPGDISEEAPLELKL